MKRKRGRVKWVGVTACALLLCAWIGTFWSALGYQFPTVVVDLSVGCFEVSVYPQGMPTQGWFGAWQPYEAYWLPTIIRGTFITSRTTHIFVPLWIPLLCVGGATIWAFKHDWRFAPGHCQTCGYDLRGAEHEACPECGRGVATAMTPPSAR